MLAVLTAQATNAAGGFTAPHLDYHALAPEIVLSGVLVLLLLVDLLLPEREKWATSTIAGVGLLGACIPILTLALGEGGDVRSMFGGAYVVDHFSLVLKALFLLTGYVTVLLSVHYVDEGDYAEGEYYFLLLSSILGMVVMSSARDLITIFLALELLSIPAYLLAGWRKRDLKGNEASLKYYLLGVLASAVMLYGMSLLYGASGTTLLTRINDVVSRGDATPLIAVGIVLTLIGFAFKISAVPFHTWAPDTYEGAPTPITAYLSVASKAAGFVAILQLVFVGFLGRGDIWSPFFWVLSALTMTVGNLIALRQTNIVRLLAYSSVAQAGYMLIPFAVLGADPSATAMKSAFEAVVVYLLIYAAMNMGAFAVVITLARKTRSGDIASYGGLFEYAPGLTVLMTVFMVALAGVPPLAGWFAKLVLVRAILDAGSSWAIILGVILAVNTAIAAFYYLSICREMWMRPVPDEDRTPVRIPAALGAGLALTAAITFAVGVYPQLLGRFGDISSLVR
jgi:NADH-quinone oxidoreductase subunit N